MVIGIIMVVNFNYYNIVKLVIITKQINRYNFNCSFTINHSFKFDHSFFISPYFKHKLNQILNLD